MSVWSNTLASVCTHARWSSQYFVRIFGLLRRKWSTLHPWYFSAEVPLRCRCKALISALTQLQIGFPAASIHCLHCGAGSHFLSAVTVFLEHVQIANMYSRSSLAYIILESPLMSFRAEHCQIPACTIIRGTRINLWRI